MITIRLGFSCAPRSPPTSIRSSPFRVTPKRCASLFFASDREATAAHVLSYAARFAEDGFAPSTVVLEAEQRVIGWSSLNKDPSAPEWEVEIAYYFDPAYWGRGLATELIRESLRYAFEVLRLKEVGAFVKPENVASISVLVKTGFERVRFAPELERDE